MHFCPNCTNELIDEKSLECPTCYAKFGYGSKWQPVVKLPQRLTIEQSVMHCPNCFAVLADGISSSKCVKCNAIFGAESSWSPTSSQVLKTASLSSGLKILKRVVGGAYIILAALLFALAGKIGNNGGELAAIPGLLFLLVGTVVAIARTKADVAVGLIASAVLLVLGLVLLNLISLASFQR